MKIEVNGATNFNHIRQVASAKETKEIKGTEIKESFLTQNDSPASKLTKELTNANTQISKMQLVDNSINELDNFASSLSKLSSSHSHDSNHSFLENEFSEIKERMLDVVDNTLFEGRALFENGNIPLMQTSQNIQLTEAIESLEIQNQGSVQEFKSELESLKDSLSESIKLLHVNINNTLAAISSDKEISSEELKQNLDVTYIKNAHNTFGLKDIDSLLG